jgi:uncharacterized protein (DUF2236 family)
MAPEPGLAISEADLERELTLIRAAAAGGAAGVFGPASMLWRVDRESALFLAAGRALLMQLAHPWVAAAVAAHSRSLADPIGRFQRTFGIVFALVFGTTEEALAAARVLHRRHAAITGVLAESAGGFDAGSVYRANDIAALCWVFATLIDSALTAFDLVLPPLSAVDREAYYRDARLFAAFFGIRQAALPPDWHGFATYVEDMLAGDMIAVGNAAHAIAAALFAGAGTPFAAPLWYRGLTARLLPRRLVEDFALAGDRRQERAAGRALAALRLAYRHLPNRLRYVAPYQEACARIAGRPPDRLTRLLNRFWIGRASLAG